MIFFSFWIGALIVWMMYLCIKSIMKSDEGTPPPQLSDVESQLSDVELSGSNKRRK
ncbi:unnamed protein product [Prunus armeniaca]|uniref:Uncharacterized protein n=1 Tax=Prunus armeniaca TaxID=36596 RepID=A0A6J5VZB9_PRUAR|nr:unnamed protein product [Prunus armeniaca]